MTRVSLTDPFVPPGVLLDKLRARNCVAFVGAGFSLPIGMPTWGGLLHLLVERARSLGREALQLTQCVECIDEKDFIVAASILRRMLNRAEILDVIGSAFSMQHYQTANADKRVRMDERIRSLVRAPWQGVVTTNFDELIEVGYQKWTPNPPQFALDFETQLGTILSRRKEGGSFFVKIHGSVGLSKIILNPQEYDAAYYTENKIRNLLNAVMLSSTLVFIGCSLEDTLLSIRKQICADHGGHIPTAFALLPCTPSNLRRSDWLREDLRIEPIIYPIANDHLAVDEFLVCCGNLAHENLQEIMIGARTNTLRKTGLKQRLQEIGQINLDILDNIAHHASSAVTNNQIIELDSSFKWRGASRHVSASERMYRVLFLVSIGLIREDGEGGDTWYMIPTEVEELLSSAAT